VPEPPSDADLVERVVERRVLHHGRYLEFRIDTIERADGTRSERDIAGHPGAVAIVAIDPDEQILFVRQWRTPADRVLLEIPAGTLDVVDEATGAIEDPDLAARRELEEETGYRAARMTVLGRFHSSPGMVSEGFTLFRAEGLTRVHDGGGVEGEDIVVHRVPLAEVPAFVTAKRAEGCAVDVKLLLLLAHQVLR
jgi:ADP-ribose pyrophosphatase